MSGNLVGAWKFEETSGNISDKSGNSFELTPVGSVTYNHTGKDGNCVYIPSGFDKYFEADNNSIDLSPSSVTYACWVYLETDISDAGVIIVRADSAESWDGFMFIRKGSSQKIRIAMKTTNNNWSDYDTTTNDIALNQWNHVAFTYTSGSLIAYVNGVQCGSSWSHPTGSIYYTSDQRLRIGSMGVSGHEMKGYIDEVYMWNTVLTPSQIALLASGSYLGLV